MPQLDPTRDQRITASIVPKLMSGDVAAIQNIFLRCIGDPRYVDEHFEDTWLAQYGMIVEPLALQWYARKIKCEFVDRGAQYFHPARDYVSCTLDARRTQDNTVVDVKCINAYRDLGEVIAYYTPQIIVQEECAHADRGSLLIVKGGTEPLEYEVYIEPSYRLEVWATVDRFWDCVRSLTPPVALQFPKIVAPEQWRTIDLDRDENLPNWADEMRHLLVTWGETAEYAKLNDRAKDDIKKLLPEDCGRLFCADACVSRAKNNAVSIRSRT